MSKHANDESAISDGFTVTSAEFRSDARTAVREAVAGRTVTVTNQRGEPRMFIMRQTEPLED